MYSNVCRLRFGVFFFRLKTSYVMRFSDWSSDVCSSDLPHATEEVAVVHNGIIENFKPLRDALIARGRVFTSETDTEVVAHLISEKVESGADPVDAVRGVLPQLRGAFALAILCGSQPDLLIGARLG